MTTLTGEQTTYLKTIKKTINNNIMNREEAKELLPYFLAYIKGEDVQHFNGKSWYSSNTLSFNDSVENYRINPEKKTEARYIPFTKETIFPHVDKWIRSKNGADITDKIIVIRNSHVETKTYIISYVCLLEEFVFEDGTPCGVLAAGSTNVAYDPSVYQNNNKSK